MKRAKPLRCPRATRLKRGRGDQPSAKAKLVPDRGVRRIRENCCPSRPTMARAAPASCVKTARRGARMGPQPPSETRQDDRAADATGHLARPRRERLDVRQVRKYARGRSILPPRTLARRLGQHKPGDIPEFRRLIIARGQQQLAIGVEHDLCSGLSVCIE